MAYVGADLPLFIVEMYTPGEIVEARRPFSAETAADALLAAKGWINDRRRDATNFRVVAAEKQLTGQPSMFGYLIWRSISV
jgi:hypothetical protein